MTASKMARWYVPKCRPARGGGLRERRVAESTCSFHSRTEFADSEVVARQRQAMKRESNEFMVGFEPKDCTKDTIRAAECSNLD